MTLLPPGVKVHLAFGYTDMRKGIDGLAMLVQTIQSWGEQKGESGELLGLGRRPRRFQNELAFLYKNIYK